jgi:hypothetical protein
MFDSDNCPMANKTGAEIDQAQMVQVRNVLHAAGECHNYETDRDVRRVLRERDELRAENERLRASVRLALTYMTAGGREYIATHEDGQAAVDVLLAGDAA